MAHLDPIELGGIGLALLVVYRALVLLQDVITRRVGAPRRSEGSQPRIRIGDPVPVTTAQCETYRERTTERMDAMEQRIMGRRLCANDNNHPNHIAFDAIKPVEKDGKLVCRVCGGELSARADDQDEEAIGKRHDIYYDDKTGTMAAVNFFKSLNGPKVISVDGSPSIKEVSDAIMKELP